MLSPCVEIVPLEDLKLSATLYLIPMAYLTHWGWVTHISINHHYTPAQRSWMGGILDSPCSSVRPSVCRRHGFRSITQVCFGISISNFICMLMVAISRSLLIFSMSLSKWPPGGQIRFFGFRTLTLLWLWISTSNFSGTILMYMGRSLLIFSNVIFKMAAWRPY